ncbi:MRC1-like domain-containing protein [Sphaerosporella brunnea]|uniref:MRC1-like domain-containing protein n=1 Tax=Sphaerosporella brunnea TaxID=1250544 RepID=A0A5J5EVF1_9PEZI|nr:MRC1-like domain-containing protein [Sphaerosporella brunnea]
MSSSPASSAPGTPVRSRVASPIILTPRSKIAALLADFDSDSDDETPKPPARKQSPSKSKPADKPAETPLFAPRDDDSEPEEEEDIRPQGKLAAAMYASTTAKKANESKTRDTTPGEEDDDIPTIRRRSLSSPEPEPVPAEEATSDEDELPENPLKNARFLELVARKRKEREEREAAEKQKEEERRERIRRLEKEQGLKFPGQDDDSDASEGAARKRAPRRKAGKKALEEMHRETSRMERNMQLAHEARTRKKVTKQSLFDKFNFKTEQPGMPAPAVTSSTEPSQSEVATQSTPASSPPSNSTQEERAGWEKLPDASDFAMQQSPPATPKMGRDPPIEDREKTPRPRLDKGKGKAVDRSPPKADKGKGKAVEPASPPKQKKPAMPLVRVNLPIRTLPDDDSDDGLEILRPEDEAKRLLAEKQKLIASLRKPRPIPKKAASPNAKAKVSAKLLHQQLVQKSRLQAIKEREERIEELKAKGIIIQTAEEREKEMLEVESLLEKARKEALAIKKREQKAEKLAKGETLDEGDGSDFEWMESEVEDGGEVYSGEEEVEDEGEGSEEVAGIMINSEASESDSEDEDVALKDPARDPRKSPELTLSPLASSAPRLSEMPVVEVEDSDNDDGGFAPLKRRPRRSQRVTDDDDEEEDAEIVRATQTPAKQVPVVPDIFKNMGQASSMGMSQLFAGTLASSPPAGTIGAKIDQMRQLPDEIMANSQAPDSVPETQLFGRVQLDYSQSQIDNGDSMPVLTLDYSQSQIENFDSFPIEHIPDPTQDAGFRIDATPAPRRFESSPTPTIPTQCLELDLEPKKRGRLRRVVDFSDEEPGSDADEASDADDDSSPKRNAFSIMKKTAKKPKPTHKPYDKSKSEAKEMVYEQAEESEDEYAGMGGLGGASDEEEGGDYDEEMKDLLDDEHQDVDERELAAFFAQREKASDEKAVNKLFRDITNGMLRKKRGAFDLDDDDSDDEYMAQERRRRQKRRQMAQIRQALLKDEKLGIIAKDPKKAAFFKVLEDNVSDDDGDFLDKTEEDLFANLDVSQSQSQDVTMDEATEPPTESESRSQQQQQQQQRETERRPFRTKKPALAEIRETLSFLGVEEPTVDLSSDSEHSDSEASSQRRGSTATVIDRTISNSSTSSLSSSSKLAFSRGDGPSGFKVPALLRRATSNLSTNTTSSESQAQERNLGVQGGLKKGGKTKSCSINFQAKRGKVIEKGEERKKKEREREAREKVRMGLERLGQGRFE